MGTGAYNLLQSVVAPTKLKDMKFSDITAALEHIGYFSVQ